MGGLGKTASAATRYCRTVLRAPSGSRSEPPRVEPTAANAPATAPHDPPGTSGIRRRARHPRPRSTPRRRSVEPLARAGTTGETAVDERLIEQIAHALQ